MRFPRLGKLHVILRGYLRTYASYPHHVFCYSYRAVRDLIYEGREVLLLSFSLDMAGSASVTISNSRGCIDQ